LDKNVFSLFLLNAFFDSNGERLNTKHEYKIEIHHQIKIQFEHQGFWSITAYGEDQLLMENDAYQYLVRSEDFTEKSLPESIFLSSKQCEATHFIPLSNIEQDFTLALRCYRPEDIMKNYDSCKELELPEIVRL